MRVGGHLPIGGSLLQYKAVYLPKSFYLANRLIDGFWIENEVVDLYYDLNVTLDLELIMVPWGLIIFSFQWLNILSPGITVFQPPWNHSQLCLGKHCKGTTVGLTKDLCTGPEAPPFLTLYYGQHLCIYTMDRCSVVQSRATQNSVHSSVASSLPGRLLEMLSYGPHLLSQFLLSWGPGMCVLKSSLK